MQTSMTTPIDILLKTIGRVKLKEQLKNEQPN